MLQFWASSVCLFPTLLHLFFFLPFSTPNLKDLEAIEPGIYSSLVWIQENDPEPLDLTFTVEEEAFGQVCACVCMRAKPRHTSKPLHIYWGKELVLMPLS